MGSVVTNRASLTTSIAEHSVNRPSVTIKTRQLGNQAMSSSYRETRKIPVDKICFFIACLYLGFVVAWLVNRQNQHQTQPEPAAISDADRQFIAYLQSSLALIERQTPATTPSRQSSPSPTVSLPPPPAITPPTTPRVIERVYVPVYPQTATTVKPAPPRETATLPPPPAPSIAPAPPTPLPPVPTSEKIKNTLVGVMDLGDRSSALFDNQGVTTRISTGEFINGWTLVEVREQQVILRRGGATKVLEVGQSF